MDESTAYAVASQFIENVLTGNILRGDAIVRLTRALQQTESVDAHHILLGTVPREFPRQHPYQGTLSPSQVSRNAWEAVNLGSKSESNQ